MSADPTIEDFFDTKSYAYKPGPEGWETRLARKLIPKFEQIEKGEALPSGAFWDLALFQRLFYLLQEALHSKTPLDIGEAYQLLDLKSIQTILPKFGFHEKGIKEVALFGDGIYRASNGKDKKFAELVNKKLVESEGKVVYWVNANLGDPNYTIEDHTAILWDQYTVPAPSKVKVTIKSIAGLDLEKKDASGTSDPYVEIGQKIDNKWKVLHKTSVIKKELNPVWENLNATIEVDTAHPLIFVVNDHDLIGHDFMGSWELDINVIHFLKEKYKKDQLSVLQRYSGLKRDAKKDDWAPVLRGALKITL